MRTKVDNVSNTVQFYYLKADTKDHNPVGVVAFAYVPRKNKFSNKKVVISGSTVSRKDMFCKEKGKRIVLNRINETLKNGVHHDKSLIIKLTTFKKVLNKTLLRSLGLLSDANYSHYIDYNQADLSKNSAIECFQERVVPV